MNNNITVRFLKEYLGYEEKMDMLVEGACKRILPISVVHEDALITAYYNTAGYKPLYLHTQFTLPTILNLLEKILMAIEECYEYLFFPEEYIINTNTIYVDERLREIRFIYIPDKEREKFQNKFRRLLKTLKECTTENGKIYLDMIIDLTSVEKISYKKLRFVITKYLQEVEKYQLI